MTKSIMNLESMHLDKSYCQMISTVVLRFSYSNSKIYEMYLNIYNLE